MNTASEWMETLLPQIDQALETGFSARSPTELLNAARYVTLGGGHRWRGLMAVAAGGIYSAEAERMVLPLAAALEMMHSASLVLDDLPSMDDAATRRGKPCVHLVFPTWVVDMLPAFLVNQAYQMVAENSVAKEACRIRTLILLGEMGAGLAQGQEQDLGLLTSTVSEEQLLKSYSLKSGSLFAGALAGGGLLCGAGPADARTLHEAGLKLGQAYQILDDIMDGADAPGGSEDAGRCSALTLMGQERAHARAHGLLAETLQNLERFGPASFPLRMLLDQILLAASA